ncbi:universal stress protein [Daeguia caeni]|uniref:Universal stress protein n=1 Tax=Daeguia caeni TaxID=439612 RepID=A0ABV9H8J4_9HYPH
MYKQLLITTDGSEFAERGVTHGLKLAKALGAKVTVMTVTAPYSASGLPGGWIDTPAFIEVYEKERTEFAQKILDKVQAQAQELGLTIEPLHVSAMHAAEAIIEKSQELNIDLIVMASHGRRGLKSFIIGSQTNEVLTRGHIPVLVVR